MRRINSASKVDANGHRVAPGDIVEFHLDPLKPWKHRSHGVVTRWVAQGVAEVRYSGPSTDDHGLYDLASHEFALVSPGGPSTMAMLSGGRRREEF